MSAKQQTPSSKGSPDGKANDFSIENNPYNEIKRTIAVLSGKGGVGKSLVTALLATYLQRTGRYRVGVLDADITGPSIPKLFGADSYKPQPSEAGLFPVRSHSNIQIMSVNLLLDKPDSPVVWRGPILANTVKQFWTDVIWGELDFLFLDMPPGTGDVPLTVFQSIPLDGIILVTSPQDLVAMIVKKAVNMAKMMNIPILGLIENMSHAICPHCGETIHLFGESKAAEVWQKYGVPYLGSLPIDPDLSRLSDQGEIERIHKNYLEEALQALEKVPARRPESDGAASDAAADPEAAKAAQKPDDEPGQGLQVAIAAQGQAVSEHFGHCEGFMLYTLADGKIVRQGYVKNPGHKPGLLPNLLHERGVQVVIAGGMGSGAVEIFNEKGIDVITGASGPLAEVIESYLAGDLASSGSVCHEHQHAGDCGHEG
jgi:Mrp family chromosome partitioning ATPase/predicted Fe-Mo cluster-binding NifX family protein